MQKISTQIKCETNNQIKMEPKKSTVDFIKHFARVYYYDKMMPSGLGGVVTN
jgi:hypothetical protein